MRHSRERGSSQRNQHIERRRSHWYDWTRKSPVARGIHNPRSSALEAADLTTRPTRRSGSLERSLDLYKPKQDTARTECSFILRSAVLVITLWKKKNPNPIIIDLKGAILDFIYSLLTAQRTVSNTYAQVARSQSCANHVQHIERSSRATCVPLGTKGQLSLFEFKSHLFELYFIGWTTNRWRRGGNQNTRRKPLATSIRKCHILKPKDSSPQPRLEHAQ